jgi:succinyl-CoA synthetase beta subunit
MKCDIIAEGIVAAAKEIKLKIPIVVRLQGTHKDLGQKILMSSNLPIITADNFEEAAVRALEAADL